MKRTDVPDDFRIPVEPVDLEECLHHEWWKTLFNENYIRTDGDVIENAANTSQDIDIVLDILKPDHSHQILDLCCGQGRHCLELYGRGYQKITGLDYSQYLLDLARTRASEQRMDAVFVQGDVRNPPLAPDSFDLIICMGNSFGYFSDDREDSQLIGRITGLLKKGGRLFLDLSDGNALRTCFEARSAEWIDDTTVVNRERTLDSAGKRLISREIVYCLEKGLIADQIYAETLYSDADIRDMLEKNAFTDVIVHRSASVLSTRNEDLGMLAHRMIITAVKS